MPGRPDAVGTVPRDRADLPRQIERGCQLITVATLEWGIQATREAVEELSKLWPTSRGPLTLLSPPVGERV